MTGTLPNSKIGGFSPLGSKTAWLAGVLWATLLFAARGTASDDYSIVPRTLDAGGAATASAAYALVGSLGGYGGSGAIQGLPAGIAINIEHNYIGQLGALPAVGDPGLFPVDDLVRRFSGFDLKVRVEDLLANDPDRADLTVTAVGPTASGVGTSFFQAPWVFYQSNGFDGDDSFSYTVRNAANLSETATVFIEVVQDLRNSLNITAITVEAGGAVHLSLRGIPGRTYRIQFATQAVISSIDDWVTLETLNADTTGLFEFSHLPTDNPPPDPVFGMYRSISP